jgi:hypothetical protein
LHNRWEIIPSSAEKAALFLNLIGNKIQHDKPDQELEAIQIFFPNLVNNDADRIVSIYVEYISDLGTSACEYQNFIKIIAKKAASYPPGTLLNWRILKNYAGDEIGKMVLDFLKEYIGFARFDDTEDILLLGQFLYNVIDNQNGYNREIFDNLPEYAGFDILVSPYIDDVEFVLRLLTIPGTFEIEHYSEYAWLNKFFTLWLLHNHAEYQAAPVWPLDSNSHKNKSTAKAAALLLTPSAEIRAEPEILDIIWRYFKIPGRIFFQDDFIPYKYFIRVNTDPEKDSALLDAAAKNPHFNRIELKVIRYIKLHGNFNFVDFSLNYNNIDDIAGFSPDVFVHHRLEKLALCLLYLKEKGDTFEKAKNIIRSLANKPPPIAETSEYLGFFVNEAANEKEGEFLKLFILTALYCRINFDIQRLLEDMPHDTEIILERCRKHLAMLRKIETKGLSNDEVTYYCETSANAAWLIAKTVSCWKGIKPLLLAFRNTRHILLNEKLKPLKEMQENIASAIFRLLNHRWGDEKAKQLRRDMAGEFCAYLKPLPEKDRGDPRDRERNYAETERNLEGFDLAYREPNPLWRYAYTRSLADLGVDVDGKGHFFHSILEKAAENDPSPAVREAAGKTAEYLRKLRDGWDAGSHKRHLVQAFWWLRRAHVLTIDERLYNEQEAVKARTSEFR